MRKYIDQLNEAQREPVLQKDGPMIIIAGAGSGKTRVLTIRIAYLMSLGVDAFSILALTFTNKAAREIMKPRIFGWELFTRSLLGFYVLNRISWVTPQILRFMIPKIPFG
jgi:superfamily I DNA and RNA helicase